MKIKYNLSLFVLLVSVFGIAQEVQVFQKSFETDKNTTVILNITNMPILIEHSSDGKLHIDHLVRFQKYSKAQVQEILNNFKMEANKFDNNISITAKNDVNMGIVTYKIKSENGLSLDKEYFQLNNSKRQNTRKTKDSLIAEMYKSPLSKIESVYKLFNVNDKDGNKKKLSSKNVKLLVTTYILKIPPYVKLKINGKDTNIHFGDNTLNEVSISLKRGRLKSGLLSNEHNTVRIQDGIIELEDISGGNYTFQNVRNGIVGSVTGADISSEFSKIEIGEIHQDVKITDFNSEYWFYNWSEDFKRFDLFSEYSKIHFFKPVNDFNWLVMGNNTVCYIGENKIVMQPNENEEKFKMMQSKAKNPQTSSGNINFDIIHGIIYSHNDNSFTPNPN